MTNKKVFKTSRGKNVRTPDAVNEAGGSAYKLGAKEALAQFGMTGTFNDQFYSTAEDQLAQTLTLCDQVGPEFVAKCALYCRRNGYMKDMPAFMLAYLADRDTDLLKMVFPRVADNAIMVKKFAQIVRSGVVGRKSFGTAIKNILREWLNSRTSEQMFRDSVGGDVRLEDLIKMVHPKPQTKQREALHGYLLGKEHNPKLLPDLVRQFEDFKSGRTKKVPNVPFQMLTSLDLGVDGWKQIAKNAKWQMTRMNLNTFSRHGVFEDEEMVNLVANRLRDEEQIRRARVFPYQLLAAYKNIVNGVPRRIINALHDAMEIATKNVPEIPGKVVVGCDVSGSMWGTPVTGFRAGSSSRVDAATVAALMASVVLRTNEEAIVYAFDMDLYNPRLDPRDTVITNAKKLSQYGGGGTDCSLPFKKVHRDKLDVDVMILVSDNQSWLHPYPASAEREWKKVLARNPKAKLVNIDTAAYNTVQIDEDANSMNIGGFSDKVFDTISDFVTSESTGFDASKVVRDIEKLDL